MRVNQMLWLMPLLVTACTMAGRHGAGVTARPLQPANCGTPNEFKPCGRTPAFAVRQVKPTVTMEVLAGPVAKTVAPNDFLTHRYLPETQEENRY
jgi:hypothetical protein